MENIITAYESFVDFFSNEISSISTLRIDGNLKGGNRAVAGKFRYNGVLWKVHKDTHIDPLRKAFEIFNNNHDPFVIVSTKGNKGECLILNSMLLPVNGNKHMYIYKIK